MGTYILPKNQTMVQGFPINRLAKLEAEVSNLILHPGTSPASPTGSVQFNNSGVFGGSNKLIFYPTTGNLVLGDELGHRPVSDGGYPQFTIIGGPSVGSGIDLLMAGNSIDGASELGCCIVALEFGLYTINDEFLAVKDSWPSGGYTYGNGGLKVAYGTGIGDGEVSTTNNFDMAPPGSENTVPFNTGSFTNFQVYNDGDTLGLIQPSQANPGVQLTSYTTSIDTSAYISTNGSYINGAVREGFNGGIYTSFDADNEGNISLTGGNNGTPVSGGPYVKVGVTGNGGAGLGNFYASDLNGIGFQSDGSGNVNFAGNVTVANGSSTTNIFQIGDLNQDTAVFTCDSSTNFQIGDLGNVNYGNILSVLVDGTLDYSIGGATAFHVENSGITQIFELRDSTNSVGTAGQILTSTGSAIAWKSAVAAGVAKIASTANLTGQTASVTTVGTSTTPNDSAKHTYRVGAYTAITAISAGTLTVSFSFVDENGTSRTLNFFPMGLTSAGLTSTGFDSFPPAVIRCNPNTAVTVSTSFTGVSVAYDVGAVIEQLT